MQPLLIVNGTVVTGDGVTMIERGAVLIEEGRIADVFRGDPGPGPRARVSRTIDAEGTLVMPGAINNHVHGVVPGPLYASGAPGLLRDEVLRRLDGHLLAGTTTLLSMDGFATMAEVEDVNRAHPVNLKAGTIHTPLNIQAAEQGDGSGLKPEHKVQTVEKMFADGAVAIAEVGAGHTLGGGGQDYLYIPMLLKQETGRDVPPKLCRKLKFAVLGRYVKAGAYDRDKIVAVLDEMGLAGVLTPERARDLVQRAVLPPFEVAIAGIREAAEWAKRLNVPMLVHNSAPSRDAVVDAAKLGINLIAGHSNHATFTPEEAAETARVLRELGATIDVAILDSYGARRLSDSPESVYRMLRLKLCDVISTDWAGGHHDPLLMGPEGALAEGIIDLPTAVALVTGNVANVIPALAPERGFLAKGKIADVVVTNRAKLSAVDTVIIGGRIVVEHGARC